MSARRPQIHGRSIVLGGEKLHVRGVTYGTFRPAEGYSLPPPDQVIEEYDIASDCRVIKRVYVERIPHSLIEDQKLTLRSPVVNSGP